MDELPKRLKWYRENLKDKNNKWTQKYVADKIGVARVTYTAYENGTKTPPPDIIIKLAELFDVTTDYLLGRNNKNQIDEELQDFIDNVKVWYKEEPETKEERLRMMKKMFEIFNEDE